MQGTVTAQGCTLRSGSDDFKFGACSKNVSQLFRGFVHFYSKVSWSDKIIKDPFEPKKNVCAGVSAEAIVHLCAELVRADDVMSRGTSLAELLEPWAPPDETCSTSSTSRNGTDSSDNSGDQATDDVSGWRSTELRNASERKPLRLKPRTIPCRTTTNLLQSTSSLRPGGGVPTSKLCVVA